MKILGHFICLLLITFLINTSDVVAEVYKWVDEKGNVHFGDRPSDSKAEKIDIKESAGSPTVDPGQKNRQEKQHKLLDLMEEERNEKKEKKAKLKEEKKKRKKMCLEAKDYQKSFKEAGAIYALDDEGNRVFYSKDEREARERELVDKINKWCK
jgi:hypothetical protein